MTRIVLISCLAALFSCNNNNTGYISKVENGGDEVYKIAGDDEEMNNAIRKALSSYDSFLKECKDPDSVCSDFSIKMMFPYDDDGGNEHMWLSDLFFKNRKLYGVLDSDPNRITSVKSGDTIEVMREQVSDWMYLRNDTLLVGGYTIKALYEKMGEKEKEQFRNEVGFIIE